MQKFIYTYKVKKNRIAEGIKFYAVWLSAFVICLYLYGVLYTTYYTLRWV